MGGDSEGVLRIIWFYILYLCFSSIVSQIVFFGNTAEG